MKRKKGIKIKHHSYNLYNRKKRTGKRVLATILTIVCAAVLCVVGFGIGRPLMEFFQEKNSESNTSTPSWTPPVISTQESSESADSKAETETAEQPPEQENSPEIQAEQNTHILPETAYTNSDSLKSALASIKSNGYSSVCITLKDSTGYLLYKTEIESVKDTDAVTGTLTARQIYSTVESMGMTAVARINTLKDHVGGIYAGGNYIITGDAGAWHDAAPANGGKKWLSPFNEETSEYIAAITKELADAGFKRIILANTIFPEFHPSDYSEYLAGQSIDNEAARLNALWNVINAAKSAAESGGSQIMLETDSALLLSDNRLGTTAELAGDSEQMNKIELLLSYSGDAQYTAAKSFIGRMGAQFSGQKYAVYIPSGSVFSELSNAFSEADIAVYSGK